MTTADDHQATPRDYQDEVGWQSVARDVEQRAGGANAGLTAHAGEAGAREPLPDVSTHLRIRRAVSRGVLAVIPLAVVLASCGGSDDSRTTSGATRSEPTTQRSVAPPPSPDAGIPEGHAVADARARRCRAAHPPRWRSWRYCDRYAR
jgi:hypothetical protein